MPLLQLPSRLSRWGIRQARVPATLLTESVMADAEGLALVDIVVADATIESVSPAGAPADEWVEGPDLPFVARGGGLVLPCFVDAHTHLDKGHTAPRAPNPDGTRDAAIEAVGSDRPAHWTAADVRARMAFSLACAYAHGTAVIRTHIDSLYDQTRITWPVFAEIRDAWAGRIDLVASPLFGIEFALDDQHMRNIADMVGAYGNCLGAVTYPGPALVPGLDRLFRLAADKGFDLDFHVDETGDPTVNTLKVIADRAIACGFQGKILAGHCCALAVQTQDEREETIERVARAGIAVVSLPLCNMYLQSRGTEFPPFGRTTPRWRGTTAYKELARGGVPVMVASDNTRDAFYAYGDLDMAEVWREATRIMHLDHPFEPWVTSVTRTPALQLRRPERGLIGRGLPADFILFAARSLSEWMARPEMQRIVIRHGRPIDAKPPAYAELDHLAGLGLTGLPQQ